MIFNPARHLPSSKVQSLLAVESTDWCDYTDTHRLSLTYLEQEFVTREPLYRCEEVRGEAEPLAERTLLQERQDLLKLSRLFLVCHQRLHSYLEFSHVHSVHVEVFQLHTQ